MSDKTLIFCGQMIKAYMSGIKTHTRRIVDKRYENWRIGDVVRFKEAFAVLSDNMCGPLSNIQPIVYIADTEDRQTIEDYRVVSPIFMPKWASRIYGQIKEIRTDNLMNITYEDVIAEGIRAETEDKAIQEYFDLFEKLNGVKPNPNIEVYVFGFNIDIK